jgi:F0F1-type ATP synthase assembly protein I
VPSQSPERQPPMAAAMRWVTEITAGGFMLAAPTVGGWWLDRQFGISPWCLIAGGFLGLVLSFLHILKITGALKSDPKQK